MNTFGVGQNEIGQKSLHIVMYTWTFDEADVR